MKPLLFLCAITLFAGCQKPAPSPKQKLLAFYNDRELFDVDTVYQTVVLGLQPFSVKILRERFNNYFQFSSQFKEDDGLSTPTLVFTKMGEDTAFYAYRLSSDNENWSQPCILFKANGRKLSDVGRLYIKRIKTAGGSGYLKDIFEVTYDYQNIHISEISQGNELTFAVHSKDENEIIFLDGIWGSGDDGHFGYHRYRIKKYTDSRGEEELGTTKDKYPSYDSEYTAEQILHEIVRKEPQLFKGVDLKRY
ncbi:hypothetical protein [Niabella hirudinis]|uniref:hypothetical protein n=1 Tax=Niabella hirudinis TaxID=1285929 RepID=UPI003EBE874F